MNLERLKDIPTARRSHPTFSVAGDGAPAHRPAQAHGRRRPRRGAVHQLPQHQLLLGLPVHLVRPQLRPGRHPGRRHDRSRRTSTPASPGGAASATTSSTPTGSATTTCTPCQQVLRTPGSARPPRGRGRPHHPDLRGQGRRRRCPGWSWSTSPPPTMRQRMIKSAEEIAADQARRADRRPRRRGHPSRPSPRACRSTRWRSPARNAMVREIARTLPARRAARTPGCGSSPGINTDGAHNWATTPPGAARRHPVAQLLPDDRRLLHRAGAHPVLRAALPRAPAAVGGQRQGAPPRAAS